MIARYRPPLCQTVLQLPEEGLFAAACRKRLKELSGRVEMGDNWRDLEAAELKASDSGG
ncbi:MAG: hypothetical protein ISQ70_09520 [Pirellulales bacterium]|nr:hypothetical protein [Pirellulales bacterium]MBL7193900.1 hypothetical protein [Pirellulales bacterium]